jgi:RNA polymerase sigma-70 factor (ECF subfamily)
MSSAQARELEGTALSEEDDVLDLIVRLRAKERSAYAEAYDRHHEPLRAFAGKLIGDADAAEDLVHDVFVALPRAIQRFEGRCSLRTFLISIAVRLCHKHVRSAARARAGRERAKANEFFGEPALPSERRMRTELAEALARALDRLPIDQRIAFSLCVLEERTSREAAAILGVNEVTVRTRMTRAREKLRAYLEEEGFA